MPLLSSEMTSPTMLSSPGKGQKAHARGLPVSWIFMLFPRGRERCLQLCTLNNDASLDGVTALGVLCLTFIGTLIFKAHAGDLQGGLCCGPLRGQGTVHFAPLDPGNRADGGEKAKGDELS